MNPYEIHFMQNSIKNATGEFTVLGNAEALATGSLNPNTLSIKIWMDGSGKIWTLDHRRLAAFRLSGLKEVPVQWTSPSEIAESMWKMNTTTGGTSIKIRGTNIIVK